MIKADTDISIDTGTIWSNSSGTLPVSSTPWLHKQHGKVYIMVCYYTKNHIENTISLISPIVNSKDGLDFARLFTLRLGERGDMGDNIYQQCSGVRCQPGRWPEKTARLIGKETDRG